MTFVQFSINAFVALVIVVHLVDVHVNMKPIKVDAI